MDTLPDFIKDRQNEYHHIQWLLNQSPEDIATMYELVSKSSAKEKTQYTHHMHVERVTIAGDPNKKRYDNTDFIKEELKRYAGMMGTIQLTDNLTVSMLPDEISTLTINSNSAFKYTVEYCLNGEHTFLLINEYRLPNVFTYDVATFYSTLLDHTNKKFESIPPMALDCISDMLSQEHFDLDDMAWFDMYYALLMELNLDSRTFIEKVKSLIGQVCREKVELGSEIPKHLYTFFESHLEEFGDAVYMDPDGFVLSHLSEQFIEKKVSYIFTKTNRDTFIRASQQSKIFDRYKLLLQCSE